MFYDERRTLHEAKPGLYFLLCTPQIKDMSTVHSRIALPRVVAYHTDVLQ